MENLNLDISKYNCDELYEIFSIDQETRKNENSLLNHFTNFKNTLLSNKTLPLNKKDNITLFIGQALEKIVKNLNFDDYNSNLTYLSRKNNIINESPVSNPLIANQNELAGKNAKIFEGDLVNSYNFSPGYINPINIKSIRRTINIDSRFRDNYFNSKSSDYIIDLPEPFRKVVKMKITAFEIPTTIHYINENYSNNFFNISGGDIRAITLPNGNYVNKPVDNSNSIVKKINEKLQETSDSSHVAFSIDPIDGKSMFTSDPSDASFSLYFNTDISGKSDSETPIIMKLGWLLGFRLPEYGSSFNSSTNKHEIKSEGICLPKGPQYLFLSINDFTNAANNHFIAAFNSSTLSPHILARFNYQALVQDSEQYNYSYSVNEDLEEENRSRSYFGPVNINRLHIQLLDEYGRIVDLNHMDWSLTLSLEILYD